MRELALYWGTICDAQIGEIALCGAHGAATITVKGAHRNALRVAKGLLV